MLLPPLSEEVHFYDLLHRCHVCRCQKCFTQSCPLVDVLEAWKYVGSDGYIVLKVRDNQVLSSNTSNAANLFKLVSTNSVEALSTFSFITRTPTSSAVTWKLRKTWPKASRLFKLESQRLVCTQGGITCQDLILLTMTPSVCVALCLGLYCHFFLLIFFFNKNQ